MLIFDVVPTREPVVGFKMSVRLAFRAQFFDYGASEPFSDRPV